MMPISFLQLISQTWFCFPARCFYLLLMFVSQEVRLLISFRLQGWCRNFWRPCFRKQPVAEDVHIDKDRAIEWMRVCAFLPVRVREFILFVCWFYHGLLVDFSLSLGTFFSPIFLCSRGYTYDFSVIWLVDFKRKGSALWRFHTSSPDAFELVLTEPQDLENGWWRSEYRQSKGDLILDYEFILIHWPHEDVKLFTCCYRCSFRWFGLSFERVVWFVLS